MPEPSLNIADLVPLLDDRDPQAIFDEWLAAVQQADPTYVPINGSLDAVIAEALCLAVADVIYAVNRLPGTVTEALLAFSDIPRYPGTPTTGSVLITLDTVRTISVPYGHRMMIDGLEFTATTTVSATASSITVPVVSTDTTSLANGLVVGTGVDLLDPIPEAVAATTTGVYSGGSDPETDSEFKARAILMFTINRQGLVLPSAFVAWTASLIDVSRAAALDLWDADTDAETAGHITVFVHGHGAALSEARRGEVEADLDARSASNLIVHVEPVTIVDVPIDMTVRLAPGADETTVLAAVESALRQAIAPAVWPWGDPVTPEEIAAITARVPGVDYATVVTVPAADVDLEVGELPAVTTVTLDAATAP